MKEREEKDFSVRQKELVWEVGKYVLPQRCVADKMAQVGPREGQAAFVVHRTHPSVPVFPKARDLNTCKRAIQHWLPGCPEAGVCSPRSPHTKEGEGSSVCIAIMKTFNL